MKAKNGDIEGLGLVTIEAMGCECPVIVSDIPAIKDVIEDGETGLLVPPANSMLLATKINQLLATPEHATNLACQGRKKVVAKFSWEISEKKYLNLINNLVLQEKQK